MLLELIAMHVTAAFYLLSLQQLFLLIFAKLAVFKVVIHKNDLSMDLHKNNLLYSKKLL